MEMRVLKDNNNWRAQMKGDFSFSDTTRFRELLDDFPEKPPSTIAIDLSQVGYIDSAGLGMLLLLKDEAVKHNTHIVLAGASGQVLKMLEVSRFQDLFEITGR